MGSNGFFEFPPVGGFVRADEKDALNPSKTFNAQRGDALFRGNGYSVEVERKKHYAVEFVRREEERGGVSAQFFDLAKELRKFGDWPYRSVLIRRDGDLPVASVWVRDLNAIHSIAKTVLGKECRGKACESSKVSDGETWRGVHDCPSPVIGLGRAAFRA